MGLRDRINARPVFSILFVAVLVGVAVALFVRWREQERVALEVGEVSGSAYYTADDGATFYEDRLYLPSPHEKDGREAYLVKVFRCGGGEPFVAYLVRHDPALTADLAKHRGRRYPGSAAEFRTRVANGTEYRRPGETTWVKESDLAATRAVRAVSCPDGQEPRPVAPPPPPPVPSTPLSRAAVGARP